MATLCSDHHHHHPHHNHHQQLSTTHRKKLIHELIQGQKSANQLQFLLHHREDDPSVHQELVVQILRSFTETLSVLSSCTATATTEVVSDDHQTQLPLLATDSCNDSPCTDDRRTEDSGESKKRPVSKDRRGCYKRKKNVQTWTVVSSATEDAHAWRKYGQKEILNAKYPRSYYRCTHKYDQGCRATKQVQRLEDNPQMYETTYIGNHTCRDLLGAPKIITDSEHPWGSTGSYTLSSFNNSNSNSNSTSTSTPSKVKQVCVKEETTSDDVSDNLSSLDSVVWEDLMPIESSAGMVSDYGDVVSTVYSCDKVSSHSFDMGFEQEYFHFEEIEFI